MDNRAVWLDGPGLEPRIGPAPMPELGEGQLLVKTMAVAVQPGEWKIQAGIIPIPLSYPTIIGLSLSGVVEKIGSGVTRFAPGDRVAGNTTGVLRDDHRFGAYQHFSLLPQALVSKIDQTSFENAASLSTIYACMSALFLHLHLERPPAHKPVQPVQRKERVLIWGVSSSLGALSAQLAREAGYTVIGVASSHHAALATRSGVSHFLSRTSESLIADLIALGPFTAVFAAADSAEDQVKIGKVMAAHGGGRFLSTMGVRPGVQLPEGVTGFFKQFLDDYIDPANAEFTRWVWWEYLEAAFADGRLESLPAEIVGGLEEVPQAWDILRKNGAGGTRLIILPGRE